MKTKYYIYLAVVIAVLLITFFAGGQYYKSQHPVKVINKTELIYDTVTHYVPNDIYHYSERIDTVYVPKIVEIPSDIDTAAILVNYYSKFKYQRYWNDSLIKIELVDVISQNRVIASNWLKYEILRPQTVNKYTTIVNNYTNYVNLSISSDILFEQPEIELRYITKKGSFGAGYIPTTNTFTFNAGVNLFKLK